MAPRSKDLSQAPWYWSRSARAWERCSYFPTKSASRRPTFEEIPDLKLPEQMEGLAETIIGHLHRLFVRQWGASPSAVAQTARLQLAKRLLDTTILPIAEIALASGFGSLRRFNAVFADATVAGRGQAITPGDARRWHPQRSSLPRADCAFPTAGMS
jgi:methylphosphotriester-DNA--protein-cysteine methyltransferase